MSEIIHGVMMASEIKENPESESRFSSVVYWHPEIFLQWPPYRRMVNELRRQYRVRSDIDLISVEYEDFVVHKVELDGKPMEVYWENSLGYTSLSSPHRELIHEVSTYLCGKRPEYESC